MTPGACHSDFDRESTGLKKTALSVLAMLIARTTEVGSRTLVAGAAGGTESQGQYMADCVVAKYVSVGIYGSHIAYVEYRPSELVLSGEGQELQTRLWDQTMKKLKMIQQGISQNI